MRTSLNALILSGAAALLTATTVSAQDHSDAASPRVIYRDVGQGRIIQVVYPTPVNVPYALTGQSDQAADHWLMHGHWIETGQSRVFIPASR